MRGTIKNSVGDIHVEHHNVGNYFLKVKFYVFGFYLCFIFIRQPVKAHLFMICYLSSQVIMWLSVLPRFLPSSRREVILLLHLLCLLPGKWVSFKGTISEIKNLQITLSFFRNFNQTVSSLHKRSQNFDRKTTFYRISPGTVSLHRKISLNFGITFRVYLSINTSQHIRSLEY